MPKNVTVTYLGPVDAADPTATFRLPGEPGAGEDLVLTKGVPQSDVTAAQFKALKSYDGHRFAEGEVDIGSPDAGAPWPDYGSLNADDVVKRLGDPDSTPSAQEARAVAAWESEHDNRSTVIEAAEQQAAAYDPQGADESGDGASDGKG